MINNNDKRPPHNGGTAVRLGERRNQSVPRLLAAMCYSAPDKFTVPDDLKVEDARCFVLREVRVPGSRPINKALFEYGGFFRLKDGVKVMNENTCRRVYDLDAGRGQPGAIHVANDKVAALAALTLLDAIEDCRQSITDAPASEPLVPGLEFGYPSLPRPEETIHLFKRACGWCDTTSPTAKELELAWYSLFTQRGDLFFAPSQFFLRSGTYAMHPHNGDAPPAVDESVREGTVSGAWVYRNGHFQPCIQAPAMVCLSPRGIVGRSIEEDGIPGVPVRVPNPAGAVLSRLGLLDSTAPPLAKWDEAEIKAHHDALKEMMDAVLGVEGVPQVDVSHLREAFVRMRNRLQRPTQFTDVNLAYMLLYPSLRPRSSIQPATRVVWNTAEALSFSGPGDVFDVFTLPDEVRKLRPARAVQPQAVAIA